MDPRVDGALGLARERVGDRDQHRALTPVVEHPVVLEAAVVVAGPEEARADRLRDQRLERRILGVDVEVVGVEPVVVDLHPVGREAGMAGGRERVGGEPVCVAVEVVVGNADRVAHRARVAHRRPVQVAVLDRRVVALLRVEVLVPELARLRRGARVDDRVAGAISVAVLDQVVVGREAQVAVVGVPEELHAIEQDAVGLLGVEAVLLGAAHQEVAADEAVGAVGSQHDVLAEAGVVLILARRGTRPRGCHRRAGPPARSGSCSSCRHRGSRPRASRPTPRSAGCSGCTCRAPARGSRAGPGRAPAAARP